MSAHRYWRLNASAQNGAGSSLVCAEMEIRATIGGADQTGSGTAIASSSATGSPASNAFDNSATTNWVASSGTIGAPWWLGYDFGVGVTVSVQQITWQARSTRFDYMPTTFDIQYSDDGATWTTAWSGTWSWSSNGQINVTTDPSLLAGTRPQVCVCT